MKLDIVRSKCKLYSYTKTLTSKHLVKNVILLLLNIRDFPLKLISVIWLIRLLQTFLFQSIMMWEITVAYLGETSPNLRFGPLFVSLRA